jgi:hypothetical protein
MTILETFKDGSRTLLFEVGDRITFPRDVNGGGFLGAQRNERATVIRRKPASSEFESIAFLEVQTDSMRNGGWGVITIAPWECEYLGPELS